jgi:hypothetical protein
MIGSCLRAAFLIKGKTMPLYTFRHMSKLPVEKFKPMVIDSTESMNESDVFSYYEERLHLLGDSGKVFVKLPAYAIPSDLFIRLRNLFLDYLDKKDDLKIMLLYEDMVFPVWEDSELKEYIKRYLFPDRILCQSLLYEPKGESFRSMLFGFIDKKGISEVECYKKANLDRRVFSKIRSDENYRPSKQTVISLAIALELGSADCKALLESAGFALSGFYKEDVIVGFFIEKKIYDIFRINEALFENGCRPLGF